MVCCVLVQGQAPRAFRDQFTNQLADGDYPRGMQMAATAYLFFSAGSMVIVGSRPEVIIGDLTVSGLTFLLGTLMHLGWLPTAWSRWLMPLSLAAMGSVLAWQAQFDDSRSGLTYVALILVILGSVTVHARPLALSGALMLAVYLWANIRVTGDSAEWALVGLAAFGIGVAGHLIRKRGVRRLSDAMWTLEQTATTDPLTGVLNRHGLSQRWPQLRASAIRRGEPVFGLLVDIDRMKNINDAFGHLTGDRAIQHTASALATVVRADDLVARFGGDEIVVLGIGEAPAAQAIRDRLKAVLHQAGDGDLLLAVTIGHVESQVHPDLSMDDLVGQADMAMYATRARIRAGGR